MQLMVLTFFVCSHDICYFMYLFVCLLARFAALLILVFFALAPGTTNGFKGWIKRYSSGYIASDEKMYLFFRCGAGNLVRKLKRVRRKRSRNQTPPPPRPCVNDTALDISESGESEAEEETPPGLLCPTEGEE